jgi:hypothetical protein
MTYQVIEPEVFSFDSTTGKITCALKNEVRKTIAFLKANVDDDIHLTILTNYEDGSRVYTTRAEAKTIAETVQKFFEELPDYEDQMEDFINHFNKDLEDFYSDLNHDILFG